MIMDGIKEEGKSLSNYNINPEAPLKIFSAVGCEKCNMIGYKGRIGIFEAIKTDEEIEKIIPENPSERDIKKIAHAQGIPTLREYGVIQLLQGKTTLSELERVVDIREE